MLLLLLLLLLELELRLHLGRQPRLLLRLEQLKLTLQRARAGG